MLLDLDLVELNQCGSMRIRIQNQNTGFLDPFYFLQHRGQCRRHRYSVIGHLVIPLPEWNKSQCWNRSGTGIKGPSLVPECSSTGLKRTIPEYRCQWGSVLSSTTKTERKKVHSKAESQSPPPIGEKKASKFGIILKSFLTSFPDP